MKNLDVATQREIAENRYRFLVDAMCTIEGSIDMDFIDLEICKILGKRVELTIQAIRNLPEDKLPRINRMLEAAVLYIDTDPTADLDYYTVYDEEAGVFQPEIEDAN